MRAIVMGLALSVSATGLGGCASLGLSGSPAAVTDGVLLDEQAAVGVELAYKAARMLTESLVKSGVIRGDLATRVAAADRRAYATVRAARAAYAAGRSTSYTEAVLLAQGAITDLLAAVGRTGSMTA